AAVEGVLAGDVPAVAARRAGRLLPGLHPGDGRVRHSRPARRLRHADDRQDALGRVLLQSRLAGVVGGGGGAAARAGDPHRALPAQPGEATGGRAMGRFTWFNATSIALGFAFLYIPILLLVTYSFNESRLVTVWGGWSTKWYVSMLENEQLLN